MHSLVPLPRNHSGYFGPMENNFGEWGGYFIVNNIDGNRTEEIVQMLKSKAFKHTI